MRSLYSIKPEIAEAIHKEANVRAGGANHPHQYLLRNISNEFYRRSRLSVFFHHQQNSPCIKWAISLGQTISMVKLVTAIAVDRRNPAIAVAPQIAIGIVLENSKPARSEGSC